MKRYVPVLVCMALSSVSEASSDANTPAHRTIVAADLLGKCHWGVALDIAPGDAYLYLHRAETADGLAVTLGQAQQAEPLTERIALQSGGEVFPARLSQTKTVVQWGKELPAPGTWVPTFVGFVSEGEFGQATVSTGLSPFSNRAYPLCVFWGPQADTVTAAN